MGNSFRNSTSRWADWEITVVIPTIGRPILEQCLAAITDGDTLPGRIIVVDQSSSAKIGKLLRPAAELGIETTHICSDQRGRSSGLNRGLEQVSSRFVAITDDDCVADSNWIARLGMLLREHPERVFTGRITTAGSEPVLGTVLTAESSIARKPAIKFDKLSGGNLGLAIDVVHQVGLFDEDPCVAYSEDGEWAYRALRHNVEIAFVPDLTVCHIGWRREDQRREQYLGYAHSHAAFFGKYLRRGDAFMLLRAGAHLMRAMRRWLSGAVRGERDLAVNGRCYALEFFPGLIAGLRSNIRPPRLQSAAPDSIVP